MTQVIWAVGQQSPSFTGESDSNGDTESSDDGLARARSLKDTLSESGAHTTKGMIYFINSLSLCLCVFRWDE